MKAVNLENLKRLKRALQKAKLKRIDSYRMQVCQSDSQHYQRQNSILSGQRNDQLHENSAFQRPTNPQSPSDQPKLELFRDENGNFCVSSEDASGKRYRKEFRLLSNTAETTVEVRAVTTNPDDNVLQKMEEDQNGERKKETDELSKDYMAGAEQKIILKVERIKWQEKTEQVINKLRKLNSLYDRTNQLRLIQGKLTETKARIRELQMRTKNRQQNQGKQASESDASKQAKCLCFVQQGKVKPCNKHQGKAGANDLEQSEATKQTISDVQCTLDRIKESYMCDSFTAQIQQALFQQGLQQYQQQAFLNAAQQRQQQFGGNVADNQ